MTWITDNTLKSAVAAANGLESAASLPAQWNAIIPGANQFAYNRIRSVLLARGFSAAEIDSWGERTGWNEQVGVCVAFWRASKGDEDRGAEFRREYTAMMQELRDLAIIIDGEIVQPSGAAVRIATGEYDVSEDLHALEDVL